MSRGYLPIATVGVLISESAKTRKSATHKTMVVILWFSGLENNGCDFVLFTCFFSQVSRSYAFWRFPSDLYLGKDHTAQEGTF